MTETPKNIQQQIAELEAELASATSATVRRVLERELAALRSQPPAPHTAQDIQAGGNISNVEQSYRAGDEVHGTAEVSKAQVQGPVTGINYGTIQAFFGGQPGEQGETLLAAYLASLRNECQQLRLSRLTGKRQSGDEGQAVPPLRLQAVYTSLAVDHICDLGSEQVRVAHLKQTLQEHHPDRVPPEQVRVLADVPIGLDQRFFTRQTQGSARGEMVLEHLIADLPDDQELTVRYTRPMLALEAIATTLRLVLLGEPGAGKSTVLRYLALLLAQRMHNPEATLPGWSADHLPVPILCPLGAVAEVLARREDGDAGQALWQTLGDILDGEQAIRRGLRDYLTPALRNGGVLLLFDGLDELPTSGDNPRAQIAHALRRFACGDGANTPIVVTSRVLPYYAEGDWKLPADEEWTVRTIQPLAFGQVRQFVQLWYHELSERDEEIGPAEAERRAGSLIDALEETRRLVPLIRSPLLLTMLAILHANKNELPDDRVVLYEESVVLLLERWEPERTMGVKHQGLLERLALPHLRLEQIREELHRLALKTHNQPPGDDGRGMLNRYELTGRMLEFFTKLRCDDPSAKVTTFLHTLNEDAGLLVARGDDAYAFPHLTFQEYLAACGLADLDDMVDQAYDYWCGGDADRWREVLLLFVGRLRERGSLSIKRDVLAWLERLLAKKIGRQAKPVAQQMRDAALAALSYREMGGATALNTLTIDVEAQVERPLRTAIVELLATPDSGVVVADRIVAAEVLAELGDPRLLDPTTGNSATDDYWCFVEKGTFWFGNDSEGDLRKMELPYDFHIGRYPVTNVEYAHFIEAGGYQERRWWTEEGWAYLAADGSREFFDTDYKEQRITLPRKWTDVRYKNPAQPVVVISWYEAQAYCAWLTLQGQTHGWLPTDEEIRLPTSLEWERAARHTDKRPYPWGNEPVTTEHVNGEETGLLAPSPVGCFPHNTAICGAQDMLGNVWVWTATLHEHDDEPSPYCDFAHRDWVRLRGGSWYDKKELMHCSVRSERIATNGSINLGIRLLKSRPFGEAREQSGGRKCDQ